MKRFAFILVVCLSGFAEAALGTQKEAGSDIYLPCAMFSATGGWSVDSQFRAVTGYSYLLAHGLGEPVVDAQTEFAIEESGDYTVWGRTSNWSARWTKGAAGRFVLAVDGVPLSYELGDGSSEWHWDRAGRIRLERGNHVVALKDLTGFDGRCAVIALTREDKEPQGIGLPVAASARTESFDLVVSGAGIAGICAALSAARSGLRVALVHNRPVLGGNNSSEVRVHLGGHQQIGEYPHLGDVVAEIGPREGGNARDAAAYEDDLKLRIVRREKRIRLFLDTTVMAVEVCRGQIVALRADANRSSASWRLEAPLFVDATGDGTVGFMAGADYRVGRESKSETGEVSAPERADLLCMGTSCQWRAVDVGAEAAFPEAPWMLPFSDLNCTAAMKGDWDWETGLGRDQIREAEAIRDYGMLVAYSNWSFVKNRSGKRSAFANSKLDWVAFVAGKRESRRLLGDVILTETDILGYRRYPDATCLTSWSIDLHYPKTAAETGFQGESFRTRCEQRRIVLYPIPFGCLYSRNVPNLMMAGRDISVTHIALGTVRVMRTTGMMGEVVGMAAAVCKERGCLPRDVRQKHFTDLAARMRKGVGAGLPMTRQEYNVHPTLGIDPDDLESIKQHEKEDWDNVDLFR